MNLILQQFRSYVPNVNHTVLAAPLIVMIILAMMILPLPALVLDMLFTFNICLSVIVLMAVVYSERPLDLGVFPTVLLIATLMRLSLNVASTRVVLLHGHTGDDAAGKVIQSFGEFVIGGNYTVGFVVFAILVIINFVVVTKGAGRVSEVSARFTLDAMPGKQMAIDADLNSGVITQEEAKKRRLEISQESDFYGSMDGASKFVRGDAIAGMLILFINILGGLAIGTMQYDLSFVEAGKIYTLLTIGDGLVAQIPSLLLSTAAAIMVTRVSSSQDMSEQIVLQLLNNSKTLYVTTGLLALLGIIPGMPNMAFLSMALITGGLGYWFQEREKRQKTDAPKEQQETVIPERELGWEDVEHIDEIGLEVGYRLIPMVDKSQDGQLLGRIKGVRKKLTQELGFLLPSIHIRDNLDLEPDSYRIVIRDSRVARASVDPDKVLAINPGQVYGKLPGNMSVDPVFGLEAIWIDTSLRDQAQTYGYTVVDPSTVIATHISQILQQHAWELLGHEQVQVLLDRYAETSPKVLEDVIPKVISLGVLVKVMQNLLKENIPVRDIRTILESIIECSNRTQDPDLLTAVVRTQLSRVIIERIFGEDGEISVITLHTSLEHILQQSKQAMQEGGVIEPALAQRLLDWIKEAAERQEVAGQAAALLVPDNLRDMLAKMIRTQVPRLNVIAYSEIPQDREITVVANIGNEVDSSNTNDIKQNEL